MTWTNAFDGGECTVTCYINSDTPVYDGIMGKGESHVLSSIGKEFTLSVSADGVVSLDGDQFDSGGGEAAIYVLPADANKPMRVSGIIANVGTIGTNIALASGDYNNQNFDTELSADGDSWAPDPCDMIDGSPAAGIYAGATAA